MNSVCGVWHWVRSIPETNAHAPTHQTWEGMAPVLKMSQSRAPLQTPSGLQSGGLECMVRRKHPELASKEGQWHESQKQTMLLPL